MKIREPIFLSIRGKGELRILPQYFERSNRVFNLIARFNTFILQVRELRLFDHGSLLKSVKLNSAPVLILKNGLTKSRSYKNRRARQRPIVPIRDWDEVAISRPHLSLPPPSRNVHITAYF